MCNLIRGTGIDGDWSWAIKFRPQQNPYGGGGRGMGMVDGDKLAEVGPQAQYFAWHLSAGWEESSSQTLWGKAFFGVIYKIFYKKSIRISSQEILVTTDNTKISLTPMDANTELGQETGDRWGKVFWLLWLT